MWNKCCDITPNENESILLSFQNSAGTYVGEALFKEGKYFYIEEYNGYYEEEYTNPIAWMNLPIPYGTEKCNTIKNKQFTKSDLKDGMVVTYRNGEMRLLIYGDFYHAIEIEPTGNTLNNYNDDLTSLTATTNSEDIVKVEYMGETLWKREKEYMTLEEAYRTGKRFTHKDYNVYSKCPERILNVTMEITGKTMFEVLRIKEFEIEES